MNLDLKQRIIAAAEEIMRTKGLAHSTTKEIARLANCSEGSLYNNFQNKEDLFIHVLRGQLPNLMPVLSSLSSRVGTRTVKQNLEEVLLAALTDYYNAMPLMAAIFSEPGLLARHRENFKKRNIGPHRANEAVANYLAEEQLLERLPHTLQPTTLASMLLGSCFQHSFQLQFLGKKASKQEQQSFAKALLQTFAEENDSQQQ